MNFLFQNERVRGIFGSFVWSALLAVGCLATTSCESDRRDFHSSVRDMEEISDEIELKIQQTLPQSREVQVEYAIFENSWAIQILVRGLLPEDLDQLHELVSSHLAAQEKREFWVLYLSDVLVVGDRIIERPPGTMELLATRFLNKDGKWVESAPRGTLISDPEIPGK
ncbi:MAG: hypothetical protein MUF31_00035 [Akkermansiaceae bacterium]|jgi:hypothetical protein|nr:hypothetical protein [Akkermansiaceae bacterium]